MKPLKSIHKDQLPACWLLEASLPVNVLIFIKLHLGKEPVDVDSLKLPKAVNPEDTLDVVGWIPGGVEDDDPICCHQVDAK